MTSALCGRVGRRVLARGQLHPGASSPTRRARDSLRSIREWSRLQYGHRYDSKVARNCKRSRREAKGEKERRTNRSEEILFSDLCCLPFFLFLFRRRREAEESDRAIREATAASRSNRFQKSSHGRMRSKRHSNDDVIMTHAVGRV